MPKYLLEVSYTLDGLKGLQSEGGSARLAAITQATEAAGGKVESFYFALGETDAYLIVDYPDNVAVAAATIAVAVAGGARLRTVALLSPADIDIAVAQQSTYRAPGH